MTLIEEPLGLADFIYAYHEACASGRANVGDQYVTGIARLQELRGQELSDEIKGDLEEWLVIALKKRDERIEWRVDLQLPLFVSRYVGANTWLRTQRSYTRAWHLCERGDWLLGIAAIIGADHKLVVRAGCDCARTALRYIPEGEHRPRLAIEATEAWCEGRATLKQVSFAASVASAVTPYGTEGSGGVAAGTAALGAVNAAYAVVHPVRAADAAAKAAASAANTANVIGAGTAVNTINTHTAHKQARAQHADMVRSRIPWSAVRNAIRSKEVCLP